MFRHGLSTLAMTLLVAVGPAAASAGASQDKQPMTVAEQSRNDRARLELARQQYEQERKQEQREIRERARRDAEAMRHGGDVDRQRVEAEQRRLTDSDRRRAEAEQRRLADSERQRNDAEQRRREESRKAERRLIEAQRAYQVLLEKTKKGTGH
jgi:F-box protein 20